MISYKDKSYAESEVDELIKNLHEDGLFVYSTEYVMDQLTVNGKASFVKIIMERVQREVDRREMNDTLIELKKQITSKYPEVVIVRACPIPDNGYDGFYIEDLELYDKNKKEIKVDSEDEEDWVWDFKTVFELLDEEPFIINFETMEAEEWDLNARNF